MRLCSPMPRSPTAWPSGCMTTAVSTAAGFRNLPMACRSWRKDFTTSSSDPKSELTALRRDARSLYEALIAPVEQHLAPGRTLVIEAEGWLARVPFEALLDSNDHYLIERAPIVHSLGQDSQARLRSDTGISADLPALVVGSTASSSADGLIPLPDVSAEADAVASGFHSVRVLKGEEATLSAVRNELPDGRSFPLCRTFSRHSRKHGFAVGKRRTEKQTPPACWTQPRCGSFTCKVCSWRCSRPAALLPAAAAPTDSTALPMLFCVPACPTWSPAGGQWTRSRPEGLSRTFTITHYPASPFPAHFA